MKAKLCDGGSRSPLPWVCCLDRDSSIKNLKGSCARWPRWLWDSGSCSLEKELVPSVGQSFSRFNLGLVGWSLDLLLNFPLVGHSWRAKHSRVDVEISECLTCWSWSPARNSSLGDSSQRTVSNPAPAGGCSRFCSGGWPRKTPPTPLWSARKALDVFSDKASQNEHKQGEKKLRCTGGRC